MFWFMKTPRTWAVSQAYMYLERVVGKIEKLERFKLESLKLDSLNSSWKVCQSWREIFQLESCHHNWKVSLGKVTSKIPTSIHLSNSNGLFQFHSKLSNCNGHFPTLVDLFNFDSNFLSSFFKLNHKLSNLDLSNFSMFPTALSSHM